ncbi:MAG: hypothetical protein KDE47_33920 [Caldilineaceae bacterium]|nr:hypothetical protein [Caldilineaceae bacterium]
MEYDEESVTKKQAAQERQWFETNRNIGPVSEFSDMTFHAELIPPSEAVLLRVLELMNLMLAVSKDQWLSDIDWKIRLPEWFLTATPYHPIEELTELMESTPKDEWHLLPFKYTNWLRGMKCRGWRWFGYTVQQNMLIVHIVIDNSPVYEWTIEHLLRAAGAKNVTVLFHKR